MYQSNGFSNLRRVDVKVDVNYKNVSSKWCCFERFKILVVLVAAKNGGSKNNKIPDNTERTKTKRYSVQLAFRVVPVRRALLKRHLLFFSLIQQVFSISACFSI